jgi:hypothetical protein
VRPVYQIPFKQLAYTGFWVLYIPTGRSQHWVKKGGADHIYVYDWKASRGKGTPPIPVSPELAGKMTVQDISNFPIQNTGYGAQMHLIAECFQRARADGAKWIAFGGAI